MIYLSLIDLKKWKGYQLVSRDDGMVPEASSKIFFAFWFPKDNVDRIYTITV